MIPLRFFIDRTTGDAYEVGLALHECGEEEPCEYDGLLYYMCTCADYDVEAICIHTLKMSSETVVRGSHAGMIQVPLYIDEDIDEDDLPALADYRMWLVEHGHIEVI